MSASCFQNWQSDFQRQQRPTIGRIAVANTFALLLLLTMANQTTLAQATQSNQNPTENLKQVSLEELGQIEVTTASKVPVKAARTPAAIYVITQEDIRRSGATSIPEALRMAPGVEVARVDSNTWALGVRGFQSTLSRSELGLMDGRSVYTPLFAGVYWQGQDTLLEDVDRIEVIRGPGGTIWGAIEVNAVISMISKSAKDTHGTLVSTGGGNLDKGFGHFRYGGGNDKDFNYRIYGKAFVRGGQFHPDGHRFDDWRMGQTGFRTDWDLHKRDTLTLQGDLYNGDAGQRLPINSYSPPFVTNVEQQVEIGGGNLLGRWKRVFTAGSDIEVQTYYDRTSRRQANFGESRDTFDIDFIHHLVLPWRQDFLWGLGARLSSGNVNDDDPTVAFTPGHFTDKLYSSFLQDEIGIVRDRFTLTIGSKLLHNRFIGFEVEPGGRVLRTPNRRQPFRAASDLSS